jgi:hypothetical protein
MLCMGVCNRLISCIIINMYPINAFASEHIRRYLRKLSASCNSVIWGLCTHLEVSQVWVHLLNLHTTDAYPALSAQAFSLTQSRHNALISP